MSEKVGNGAEGGGVVDRMELSFLGACMLLMLTGCDKKDLSARCAYH